MRVVGKGLVNERVFCFFLHFFISFGRNPPPPFLFFSWKHVSAPVWQTGPFGLAFIRRVSWSQSGNILTTSIKLLEVSPLVHKRCLDRLKKVTRFSSLVLANASSFMKPSINTLSVLASCTIQGNNPLSFVKFSSFSIADISE